MRRPILGQKDAVASWPAAPGRALQPTPNLPGPQLAQRLRKARSKQYVEAGSRLDAGGQFTDPHAARRLAEAVAAEFPDLALEDRPLGIVAICRLGAPFEVHICDFTGMIIEHFPRGKPMPGAYERARTLAVHPAYAFIEVFLHSLRAVAVDGTVSTIET